MVPMVSAYSPRWFTEDRPQLRACDIPGCAGHGQYKAPRSRKSAETKDYHWFCLEHVTAYNKSWNYFAGMSDAQMENFWRDASHGHRPTWQRDRMRFDGSKLSDAVRRSFADYFTRGQASPDPEQRIMPVDRRVQDALAVLDLSWPVTVQEVKAQFKLLVKKYHPDVNKSKSAEDRFKNITRSYQLLCDSLDDAKG